jgi:hypothetical protein
MVPTSHLRFVERDGTAKSIGPKGEVYRHKIKILQQWWHDTSSDVYFKSSPTGSLGKWIDVPVETE